jgi:Bacterial regulatory proteins, luxR family/PAS domain
MENAMSDKDEAKPPGSTEPSQRPEFLEADQLSTQTIDLGSLLTKDVTTSGSFDVSGGIWATTFGKLMQALPIPVLLVDESYGVVVANQAFGRLPRTVSEIQGAPFHYFFSDPTVADEMQSVLEAVFTTRIPQVVETIAGHRKEKIWCRMTFRSIRMGGDRFTLIVIEDLTAEKRALILKQKQEQLHRRHRDEMEQQVKERTIELSNTNEALRLMIDGMQQKIEEDRQRITDNVHIRVKPLIDLLKSEHIPDHVRPIVKALELSLEGVFTDYHRSAATLFAEFTPREMMVVDLLKSNLSSKQIASIMGISVEGVNHHRLNIRKKLGIEATGKSLSVWLRQLFVPDD